MRRRIRQRMKEKTKPRKLSKVGRNSVGVILPANILDELGWHKRQNVIVKKVPRGILIIDSPSKKRTIKK